MNLIPVLCKLCHADTGERINPRDDHAGHLCKRCYDGLVASDRDRCFECDDFIQICIDCGHTHCPHCDEGCPYCAKMKPQVDFSCRVCGKECPVAPEPPARAVCEEHCEDHEYERCLDRGWHHCIHCDHPVDPDWYYCDDDITGIG